MIATANIDLGFVTQAETEEYILRQSESETGGKLADAYLQTNRSSDKVAHLLMQQMLKFSDRPLRPDEAGRFIYSGCERLGKLVVAKGVYVNRLPAVAINLDAVAAFVDPYRLPAGPGGVHRPMGIGIGSVDMIVSLIGERAADLGQG